MGLGAGGLARHLLNQALLRAQREPLLPPPAGPNVRASALLAQSSGANDSIAEIQLQLGMAEAERQEEWEDRADEVGGGWGWAPAARPCVHAWEHAGLQLHMQRC